MTAAETREKKRIDKAIEALANKRVQRLSKWFAKAFSPRHELQITFGMGAELVEINGHQIDIDLGVVRYRNREVPALKEIADAIDDVCGEITNYYRAGCPDNLKVRGQRKA